MIGVSKLRSGVLCGVLLAGCYQTVGEPPVPGDRLLVDLSEEDYSALCTWMAEAEGYPTVRTEECTRDGHDFVRSTASPGVCTMYRLARETDPDCEVTVAQLEECVRAVDGVLCRTNLPECRWPNCRGIVP